MEFLLGYSIKVSFEFSSVFDKKLLLISVLF